MNPYSEKFKTKTKAEAQEQAATPPAEDENDPNKKPKEDV